jgi:hypothetical protein
LVGGSFLPLGVHISATSGLAVVVRFVGIPGIIPGMVVLAQTVARYGMLSMTGCSVFARGVREIEEMWLTTIGTGAPVVLAAKPGARDVAAIRISFNLAEYGLQFLPTDLFATQDWLSEHNVGIGDRLVISGMFSEYVGSVRDEPILRFGRISLIPTEKLRIPPQGLIPGMEIEAILAEAASWGGQSGSPAFVYFSFDRGLFVGDRVEMRLPNPRLLGLVHGHYNIVQRVIEKDAEYQDLRVPLNAGIAIIVPAMKILELLNSAPVVEDREELKRAPQEEGR